MLGMPFMDGCVNISGNNAGSQPKISYGVVPHTFDYPRGFTFSWNWLLVSVLTTLAVLGASYKVDPRPYYPVTYTMAGFLSYSWLQELLRSTLFLQNNASQLVTVLVFQYAVWSALLTTLGGDGGIPISVLNRMLLLGVLLLIAYVCYRNN